LCSILRESNDRYWVQDAAQKVADDRDPTGGSAATKKHNLT
jgi:hypothetical protein